ncbi:MAG: RNA 2',3'-cyclic phosphodiesterase [Candidatus Nanopelagicales bacterium]
MTDRLFVAIWPDASAREALAATLDAARTEYPDIRWQPESRWHVTLAFLGESDPSRTSSRLEALAMPASEPIRLEGSGTFGPIVWVGVEHGPWLTHLAARIRRKLRVDEPRFRAHVTVGRARGNRMTVRAKAAAAGLAEHSGPAWTPGRLTLVGSRIGPDPEYRVIAEWPLR